MIYYDLEGRRRIAVERIERLADDYRRASRRSPQSLHSQRVGLGSSQRAKRSPRPAQLHA